MVKLLFKLINLFGTTVFGLGLRNGTLHAADVAAICNAPAVLRGYCTLNACDSGAGGGFTD